MQIELGLGWLADISHDHRQRVVQRQQRALILIIDKSNHYREVRDYLQQASAPEKPPPFADFGGANGTYVICAPYLS
jgi:hypothetical protein